MYYPLILNRQEIFPLFGSQLNDDPHIIDLSSNVESTFTVNTEDFDEFQKYIFDQLETANRSWGISRYLEERSGVLRNFPEIIDENRVYHLGLDIIAPYGFKLYAPIPGTVFEVGREEEYGSYGGYVVLRHDINGIVFYSFYGHLKTPHQVSIGQILEIGQEFATLGERADSGHWFTHTHLQILTERAIKEGRLHQGYATPETLKEIDYLFPNPGFLFRW